MERRETLSVPTTEHSGTETPIYAAFNSKRGVGVEVTSGDLQTAA